MNDYTTDSASSFYNLMETFAILVAVPDYNERIDARTLRGRIGTLQAIPAKPCSFFLTIRLKCLARSSLFRMGGL